MAKIASLAGQLPRESPSDKPKAGTQGFGLSALYKAPMAASETAPGTCTHTLSQKASGSVSYASDSIVCLLGLMKSLGSILFISTCHYWVSGTLWGKKWGRRSSPTKPFAPVCLLVYLYFYFFSAWQCTPGLVLRGNFWPYSRVCPGIKPGIKLGVPLANPALGPFEPSSWLSHYAFQGVLKRSGHPTGSQVWALQKRLTERELSLLGIESLLGGTSTVSSSRSSPSFSVKQGD